MNYCVLNLKAVRERFLFRRRVEIHIGALTKRQGQVKATKDALDKLEVPLVLIDVILEHCHVMTWHGIAYHIIL